MLYILSHFGFKPKLKAVLGPYGCKPQSPHWCFPLLPLVAGYSRSSSSSTSEATNFGRRRPRRRRRRRRRRSIGSLNHSHSASAPSLHEDDVFQYVFVILLSTFSKQSIFLVASKISTYTHSFICSYRVSVICLCQPWFYVLTFRILIIIL